MHKFTILPEEIPVPTPGDIDINAFANRSTFGTISFLVDQAIILPNFVNNSVLNPFSITIVDPIVLPSQVNSSTLNALTIAEAPADGIIRLPGIASVTVLNAMTIAEAPADGIIRLPGITNASAMNPMTIAQAYGAAVVTLGDVVMSATGLIQIHAALADTLGDVTILGTGARQPQGQVVVTIADVTIAATGASVADQWDSTFAPTKFTLSGGNLVATATAHSAVDTIISKVSHSSGKYYFELTVGLNWSNDLAWGLSDGSAGNAQLIGGNTHSVAYRNFTNNWRFNGSETATGSTPWDSSHPGAGDNLGFAVDLTNDLIWIRNATKSPTAWYGNNGVGDPVAGTNGFHCAGLGASHPFLAFSSNANGVDEPVTLVGTAAGFVATAPTGFSPWG